MTFDWLTFGFQLVNIVVLLAILRHFLFKPLAQIIAARQAGIDKAMADAAKAQADADKAGAAARAELDKAEAVRLGALKTARTEAEAQSGKLLDDARATAAGIIDDARAAAKQTAKRGEKDLADHVRDLAETVAGKALSALPDPPTVAGFAERLAAALADLPEGKRKSLLAGGNLRLVAPHKLSAKDLKLASTALGIETLASEVDATLIAGLDLRSDTGVLQNSVAHDLARISGALDADDAERP